jgi:hypothetical protein
MYTQLNDTLLKETKHSDNQHNDNQHNDIKHIGNLVLLSVAYAECFK